MCDFNSSISFAVAELTLPIPLSAFEYVTDALYLFLGLLNDFVSIVFVFFVVFCVSILFLFF